MKTVILETPELIVRHDPFYWAGGKLPLIADCKFAIGRLPLAAKNHLNAIHTDSAKSFRESIDALGGIITSDATQYSRP